MNSEITLIQQLRKIQLEWQMDSQALAKITHVPRELLEQYLAKPAAELTELPNVPAGFETAVPLVSIFQNLGKSLLNPEKQTEWLVTPNETFEGNKPIEVMAMSPAHLAWVSYTLESSTVAAEKQNA